VGGPRQSKRRLGNKQILATRLLAQIGSQLVGGTILGLTDAMSRFAFAAHVNWSNNMGRKLHMLTMLC
jgi:hypothetical protein